MKKIKKTYTESEFKRELFKMLFSFCMLPRVEQLDYLEYLIKEGWLR